MRSECIVWGCKNKGIHRFPKDETVKLQWIQAMELHTKNKVGRKLSAHSYICSGHFKPTDFVHGGGFGVLNILKKNVVPSIFYCTPQSTEKQERPVQLINNNTTEANDDINFNPSSVSNTYSRQVLPTKYVEIPPYIETRTLAIDKEIDPLAPESSMTFNDESMDALTIQSKVTDYAAEIEIEDSIQANQPPLCEVCFSRKTLVKCSDISVQTEQNRSTGFSIDLIKHVDRTVHFYTGLECYAKFMLVFHTLGPSVNNLIYFYVNPPSHIDPLNQFFITLIILYRHKTFEEISNLFLITVKQVYNIFITWIRFMKLQWDNLDIWVDTENIKSHMPLDFFDKYPATRIILDATECPIKRPKLPLAQQITFSSYKNRNTIKFMIGITPNGFISYISPCYGGSATDRQIIERSTILNRFNYGDEIMVDKGINIQDILISKGVKVNMPAFFKKGSQIQPSTLSSNRKVASKRVHVERVIGLLKTYKILTQPMNHTETILCSDIVFICAMLVNFKSNIINKNA